MTPVVLYDQFVRFRLLCFPSSRSHLWTLKHASKQTHTIIHVNLMVDSFLCEHVARLRHHDHLYSQVALLWSGIVIVMVA